MRRILTTITLLLLATICNAGGLWFLSEEKEIATAGDQKLTPNEYLLAKLDVANFNLFQGQIPTEFAGDFPIIELPKPDGTMGNYYIFEVSILESGIAARYPMIKTYTLVDTENPHITGKADFTVWGFHAKIFDGKSTYFIDPYKRGNTEWYLVFYKRDYSIPVSERMVCLVDDANSNLEDLHGGGVSLNNNLPQLNGQQKTFGTVRRTYRLALACTLEYSAAVAGVAATKAAVLSAMVTTMNRVNGVFEREFSMMAQLINNTDDVIYLPGAVDPYTNGNGSTMLGENQTNLNNVIGAANFDFGHVFSTGGGGIASFRSVCRNSKARGVTGRNNPVGDPFDIDYVAHEMGHQFGGSHTFNSASGSCSGNGSSTSSYEPGSGTTIMAYAGICGSTDNIQNNSDDYYHIRSLLQMSDHMDGQGNCATNVNTNNTPPNLNSINRTYNIPYKTYFELDASATDADSNPITYCWEQWDLGAYGPWNTVSTGNPLFRSFVPSNNGRRVFPELEKVRNEFIKTKGEVLPEVSRALNFKVAARDIMNGYGSFNYSDEELGILAFNTGNNLFRVTSHANIGQTWTGDNMQTVTWNTAGTESGSVNTPTVDIYLSLDSGKTWPYLLVSNVPNDGSQDVGVPNVSTAFGLIKVKGHNNIFFDLNDRFITIVAQPYPVSTTDMITNDINIYPNPATNQVWLENLPTTAKNVQILNTNGQLIKEYSNLKKIDISEISNGLYFIKVLSSKRELITRKLMIQR